MSSWAEPQYESNFNQPYLHSLDVPDGSMRGADHPPTMLSYPYTSRPSPNSSRQAYSPGLYGPRPQPTHLEPMQGFPSPHMVPRAMTEPEEATDEYMEVEPTADLGSTIYRSEYDDEPRPQKKLRFVGGFIRGLKRFPKAVRRGFSPDKREVLTPPGLAYHQSPDRAQYIDDVESSQSPYHHGQYIDDTEPQEPEAAPPYDAPSEHLEGDWGYEEGVDMPTEFRSSPNPSRALSRTIRTPRSESQITYQSLTDPLSRHVSQHGSLHPSQRSSHPRTVRNPDPPSPTEGSGTINAYSPRPEQLQYEPELDSAPRTPLSPLAPTRRPIVMVQSPTGDPVYFDPPRSEDYAGMDVDSHGEDTSEASVPSQFARIAKFFRDLNNLPWVSPNVTVDFDPADAERARLTHAQGSGKSWYTGHLQDLDLLAGGSSTRRLTAPSGHSLGPAPGSSTTLAPFHGPGSASSSEGTAAHLPAAPTLPSYPYPVQTLALPPHPLYYYPYPGMPQQQQQQQQQQQPLARTPEQVSPQSSGNSDVPRQPFLYVVAMPPGYVPGQVDPARPMQPAFGVPYPPPV
jgi:hypothetical protein